MPCSYPCWVSLPLSTSVVLYRNGSSGLGGGTTLETSVLAGTRHLEMRGSWRRLLKCFLAEARVPETIVLRSWRCSRKTAALREILNIVTLQW